MTEADADKLERVPDEPDEDWYRRLVEARVRASNDAEILARYPGIVDYAVDTLLQTRRSDGLERVAAFVDGGDLDSAEALIAEYFCINSEGASPADSREKSEHRVRTAAQLAWTRASLASTRSIEDARYWYDAALQCDDIPLLRLESMCYRIWTGDPDAVRGELLHLLKQNREPSETIELLTGLAGAFEDVGAEEDALYLMTQAQRLRMAMAEAAPHDIGIRIFHGRSIFEVASLAERLGRKDDCAKWREQGVAAFERLLQDTNDADIAELLCAHLVECALSFRNIQKWDGARNAYRRAEELLDLLEDEDGRISHLLSLVYEGMGDVNEEEGRRDRALDLWRRALASLETHLAAAPADADNNPAARERLDDLRAKLA